MVAGARPTGRSWSTPVLVASGEVLLMLLLTVVPVATTTCDWPMRRHICWVVVVGHGITWLVLGRHGRWCRKRVASGASSARVLPIIPHHRRRTPANVAILEDVALTGGCIVWVSPNCARSRMGKRLQGKWVVQLQTVSRHRRTSK